MSLKKKRNDSEKGKGRVVGAKYSLLVAAYAASLHAERNDNFLTCEKKMRTARTHDASAHVILVAFKRVNLLLCRDIPCAYGGIITSGNDKGCIGNKLRHVDSPVMRVIW